LIVLEEKVLNERSVVRERYGPGSGVIGMQSATPWRISTSVRERERENASS
jgi:hypothetical protein